MCCKSIESTKLLLLLLKALLFLAKCFWKKFLQTIACLCFIFGSTCRWHLWLVEYVFFSASLLSMNLREEPLKREKILMMHQLPMFITPLVGSLTSSILQLCKYRQPFAVLHTCAVFKFIEWVWRPGLVSMDWKRVESCIAKANG